MEESDQNPYQRFDKHSQQFFPLGSKLAPEVEQFNFQTTAQNKLKIKKRIIKHKDIFFGRGANHPSFFLRKFFSYIQQLPYSEIYKGHPRILFAMKQKADRYKAQKNRFNLQDLKQFFGEQDEQMKKREKYLNSKLLFQLISDKSHELIFSGGKCNQVLNHLISMEKYSGRLCNPKLVGRVEFQ